MQRSLRISEPRAQEILRCALSQGFAQTSLIVHDIERMSARLDEFRDAFPRNALHALAIKANPIVEILKIAVDHGFGLEAASIEEVELARAADCPPHKIVFDSPAKTVDEIRRALNLGIFLNIDNFVELQRVSNLLETMASQSGFGLRVNPEIAPGSIAHTSVGSSGSKFGVSISSERSEIIDAYQKHDWLTGIHVHVGSQGCGVQMLGEAVAKVEGLRQEIQSKVGRRISIFDIGGGLPAAYTSDDRPPTPGEYADHLRRVASGVFAPEVQIVTEFGRSIQANVGIAYSKVESVRQTSKGNQLAVIHLGADFLLRPVYRSQDWRHEFLCFDAHGNLKSGVNTPVTIAGPLCFSGDVLANELSMPTLEEGDWIAIRDCGAYTLSMWSRHCNRAIPTVLGYAGEKLNVLRGAETPEDVVRMWS